MPKNVPGQSDGMQLDKHLRLGSTYSLIALEEVLVPSHPKGRVAWE